MISASRVPEVSSMATSSMAAAENNNGISWALCHLRVGAGPTKRQWGRAHKSTAPRSSKLSASPFAVVVFPLPVLPRMPMCWASASAGRIDFFRNGIAREMPGNYIGFNHCKTPSKRLQCARERSARTLPVPPVIEHSLRKSTASAPALLTGPFSPPCFGCAPQSPP